MDRVQVAHSPKNLRKKITKSATNMIGKQEHKSKTYFQNMWRSMKHSISDSSVRRLSRRRAIVNEFVWWTGSKHKKAKHAGRYSSQFFSILLNSSRSNVKILPRISYHRAKNEVIDGYPETMVPGKTNRTSYSSPNWTTASSVVFQTKMESRTQQGLLFVWIRTSLTELNCIFVTFLSQGNLIVAQRHRVQIWDWAALDSEPWFYVSLSTNKINSLFGPPKIR
jgi:hypothetical protein